MDSQEGGFRTRHNEIKIILLFCCWYAAQLFSNIFFVKFWTRLKNWCLLYYRFCLIKLHNVRCWYYCTTLQMQRHDDDKHEWTRTAELLKEESKTIIPPHEYGNGIQSLSYYSPLFPFLAGIFFGSLFTPTKRVIHSGRHMNPLPEQNNNYLPSIAFNHIETIFTNSLPLSLL